MAQPAVAAESRSVMDALHRHIATIEANTTNPKVLDATYEIEGIVLQLWPVESSDFATVDRWSEYKLSAMEARLTDILFRKVGKAVSNDSLSTAWTAVGRDPPGQNNIKVHMTHIRKKIRNSPWVIKVVWGLGYRMELKPT